MTAMVGVVRMMRVATARGRVLAAGIAVLLLVSAVSLVQRDASATARIFPLRDIVVQGGDEHNRAVVLQALDVVRGDNLFLLDMEGWQRKLEALPGIGKADLRRELPFTLQVQLRSSVPIARWHGGGLIDADGGRFYGVGEQGAPVFRADEDKTGELAAFYRQATQLLPNNIAQVELDARGDWRVYTTDGVLIHLGQDEPLRQLQRYVLHADALARAVPILRSVDMRYERGFAVQPGRLND